MLIIHKGRGGLRALFRLPRRGRQARHHVDDQVDHRAAGARSSWPRACSTTGCWCATSFPRSATAPLPPPRCAQVMDMTTGVQVFGGLFRSRTPTSGSIPRAASPLPKPEGYDGPDGYWEYLQQVRPEGKHGDAFHYKTINSDMLGWIISRVTGQGRDRSGLRTALAAVWAPSRMPTRPSTARACPSPAAA